MYLNAERSIVRRACASETINSRRSANDHRHPRLQGGHLDHRPHPQRGRLQHPSPHDQQGEGRLRELRRHLRDGREPARVEGHREGGRRLHQHQEPRPRRAPAHRRLLPRRGAPDDRLRVDRRAPRGRRVPRRRRPDDQGRDQAGHLRVRLRRLRPGPVRQLQGRRDREDQDQPRGLRPHLQRGPRDGRRAPRRGRHHHPRAPGRPPAGLRPSRRPDRRTTRTAGRTRRAPGGSSFSGRSAERRPGRRATAGG